MAINMHERKEQLQELNAFICNARGSISYILSNLNWNEEKLRDRSTEMVSCPLNKEHYVPKDKLEQHIASCSWRMDGYHEDGVPLPESSWTDGSSLVIDKETRTAVIREAFAQDTTLKTGIPAVGLDDRPIPKTADRITSDFTVDERRILYDFVIQKTKTAPTMKVEELEMPFKKEEKERPKTYLERLAAERDAKRRKVSKKVHTNRKSQVEIMREVIQNQMELYEEHLMQLFPGLRKKDDHDSDNSVGPSMSEKGSPSRKRENSEHREDEYRYKNESRERHTSYEESRGSSDYRSHRQSEYDRREENKSHRDRNSSTYYRESGAESRSGSSNSKHTYKERDHRQYRDDSDRRSEMQDSQRKRHRETSYEYDYHGKKQYRERSRSYDSKSRKVCSDRSESCEYQSKSNKNEDYRSERREKLCSDNYNTDRGDKYRDRSSSSESQHRKRNHEKSYTKEYKNNNSSDKDQDYRERKKSRNSSSTVNYQQDDKGYVEYVKNQNFQSDNSYHFYSDKERLGTEECSSRHGESSSISYRTEIYKKKYRTENEDVDKGSYYIYDKSKSSYNYLECNEIDMNRDTNKAKHKRKKHKKHKKCHRKSVHKSDNSENSSDDFSC